MLDHATGLPRAILRATLALALSFASVAAPAGAQTRAGSTSGPFLKVGDLYLLYAFPIAPLAEDGRVMVPLRSFATLLGAGVEYRPGPGLATATLAGRTAEFTVVNADSVQRDAPTGALLVPLRSLTEPLGLTVRWDPRKGVATVDGPSVPGREGPLYLPGGDVNRRLAFADFFDDRDLEREDAFPTSFSWDWGSDPPPGTGTDRILATRDPGGRLNLSARTVEGSARPRVSVLVEFVSVGGLAQGFGDGRRPTTAGVAPSGCAGLGGSAVECRFRVGSAGSAVLYVLARLW